MSEEVLHLDLDYEEYVLDTRNRKLQSSIITDIMLYACGEKKTADQISEHLNLHIIKTQYYLDYMVQNNTLIESNELIMEGIMVKAYELVTRKANANIKIGSQEQLVLQSKQFGKIVEDAVCSMKADKINAAKVTSSMLTEENAKIIMEEIYKLHLLMDRLEEKSNESGEEVKKYTFLSTFTNHEI